MSEDKSLVCDCLELAFGVTIVAMVLPLVVVELTIEKVKAYKDLLRQMEIIP